MAKTGGASDRKLPKDETKSAKFVRVVTPRVSKAVKALKIIGYCSGSAYEYTPKQVGEIINVLGKTLDNLSNRFKTRAESDEGFSFSE